MQASHETAMLSSIMVMHNRGVKCFQEKTYGEAVKLFSNVLSTVKAKLGGMSEGVVVVPDDTVPFCRFLSCGSAMATGSEDKDILLFECPLLVNNESMSHESRNGLVKLSFVTLYNLALTYQCGAQEARDPDKLLDKALTFYELTHQIQETPGNEVFALVFNMAIVNNIGLIHRHKGREAQATRCFEHLLTMVMYVIDCGEGSSVFLLESFVHNIQRSVMNSENSAPAA